MPHSFQDDESKSAMTLSGLKYLQKNCVSECRNKYVQKYCNCSISLFYPIGEHCKLISLSRMQQQHNFQF
jgi:hypothetical protein